MKKVSSGRLASCSCATAPARLRATIASLPSRYSWRHWRRCTLPLDVFGMVRASISTMLWQARPCWREMASLIASRISSDFTSSESASKTRAFRKLTLPRAHELAPRQLLRRIEDLRDHDQFVTRGAMEGGQPPGDRAPGVVPDQVEALRAERLADGEHVVQELVDLVVPPAGPSGEYPRWSGAITK